MIKYLWIVCAAVAFICGILIIISSNIVKKKDPPDLEASKKMRNNGILFIVAGIALAVLSIASFLNLI